MKTREVTFRVPVIEINWWTVVRWIVWLAACVAARTILPKEVGSGEFLATVTILALGAMVLTSRA